MNGFAVTFFDAIVKSILGRGTAGGGSFDEHPASTNSTRTSSLRTRRAYVRSAGGPGGPSWKAAAACGPVGVRHGRTGRWPPNHGSNDWPLRVNIVCTRPTTSRIETTRNPTQNVAGSSTPSAPPNTHASCSTVSERPNADARDSSGKSSWITASRLFLASALAVAPVRPTIAAVAMPGMIVATTVDTRQPAIQASTIWSGCPRCIRAPMPLPMKLPAPAAPAITPSSSNCWNACPSVCARTANAENIIRNPVSTRMVPFPEKPKRQPMGRNVVVSLSGNGTIRVLTGFLMMFSAFAVRAQTEGHAFQQLLLLGVIAGAAGAGSFIGNGIGARMHLGHPDQIVLACIAGCLVSTVVATIMPGIATAAIVGLTGATASALAKNSLDAVIQDDLPDESRASAFGRSETVLQLAWVFGGALGVLLPATFWVGFLVVSILLVVGLVQTMLTRKGQSLLPWFGGQRPVRPWR